MKANKCKVCKVRLTDENWYASNQKIRKYICKECENERKRLWREANPDKLRAINTRYTRKQGHRGLNENRECSSFLGIHVAERVLSKVFKDVERMPYNNPGFDFICNQGKWIDVKSACLNKHKYPCWQFNIKRNTIADYFLCLAFNNREDLTPLHAWLLPGSKFNHLSGTTIRPSTIHKWDAHRLDISKISECCDAVR